jgi:hypothetical protein
MSTSKIHEQDQQRAFVADLADKLGREYQQSDEDRLIQYSTWGHALWGYLRSWRTPVASPGAPCPQMIIASANPDWFFRVETDDPAGDQTDYLHHAYANQNLDSVGCRVNISDNCTDSDNTQLFMQRGEVMAYWSSCDTCYSWLLGVARAEREPVDDDPQRRAKHILEVLQRWGEASIDLSSHMREEDPVEWARSIDGQAAL